MGAFCVGAVVAPIYHTNSPEECACDEEQLAKILSVRSDCPRLEHGRRTLNLVPLRFQTRLRSTDGAPLQDARRRRTD